MAERVAIALGSNLGDREGSLRFARDAIGRLETTKVVAATAVEETAPLGPPGQPAYRTAGSKRGNVNRAAGAMSMASLQRESS